MKYIDTIKLPSQTEINGYMATRNLSVYPWTIFFNNQFEWLLCDDITILYGNNGSGKSTLLNLIAQKIGASQETILFKDIFYDDYKNDIHPFDDFVNSITIRNSYDDLGEEMKLPTIKKLITSDEIFKSINRRNENNRKALEDISHNDKRKSEMFNGYSIDSYNALVERFTKKRFDQIHTLKKEQMRSNGESALMFFSKIFESGGIYLLDEPENCLSSIFQLELINLIQDSAKYFDCQFIICTHSPLILGINGAKVYNMDLVPVKPQNWYELENVRIYYEFFKLHKNDFEK